MKQLKYEVYAVDRAGTPWRVAEMNDPGLALACIQLCREKERNNPRVDQVFGITETDEPEKGDVQMELEELTQLCAWCGKTAAEGCDMEAHNAAP